MLMEMILAGMVASSANTATRRAAAAINQKIEQSTQIIVKRIAQVEYKIDQMNIKIDKYHAEEMRLLTWHDYIQTLHVKGATYKGNEMYEFREYNTTTTANLATKIVREVNGSFTFYKNFNDDTEQLFLDNRLVYEKFENGEISVYDDNGKLYIHKNLSNDTYTYLPNGQTESVKWSDGAVWIYKYDKDGIISEVESYSKEPKKQYIQSVSNVNTTELRYREIVSESLQ